VSATVSRVAPLSVCPNAGIGDVASANFDRDPEDLHRVRVKINWNRGVPEQIVQTTLIPNPNP
jgi:hypothetical protein